MRPLSEIATLAGRIGWKGLTKKEYTKSGPLFLSVHSLNYGDYVDFRDAYHISQERYDESPEIMIQENDVLICKDGAGIGKTGIVGKTPGQTTINSSLLMIRAGNDLHPKFLYHALCSPAFQSLVQSRLEGATTPHLYQRDIKTFTIPLPPLPEQERIVSILDEAFAAIDIATANAEKNLANARELFESCLESVFEPLMSCRKVPLSKLCLANRTITYGVIKLGEADPHGTPCLRTSNVRRLAIDKTGVKRISPLLSQDYHRTILKGGEVLVNVRGTLGGVAVASHSMAGWNVSREVAVVPADPNLISPEYLAICIATKTCQNWLTGIVKGIAYRGINIGDLRKLPIPVPPVEAQNESVLKLQKLKLQSGSIATRYANTIANLAMLKQSILHKAFTGELTADPASTDRALSEAGV